MKRKNGLTLLILGLLAVLLAVISIFGNSVWDHLGYQNINLGLDLRGGVYVVYEAVDYTPSDAEMSSAVSMIQQRLDSNNWTEAEVSSEGTDRIRVEIPGVEDAETAINEIGQTAHLYFTDEEGNVLVDGSNVTDAYKSTSSQNGVSQVVVALEFDSTGKAAFAEATQNNIGNRIYILLDDQVISAPTVNTAILDGSAIITGDFTNEEAQKLANLIKSGSLPFDLRVIESNSIGARLGASSLSTSLFAGLIGIILVFLFILLVYRGLGFLADWALIIYIGLDVLILSLFNVTLTLPGIAGIILSIGMAVDGNVIIFERIKEEIAAGRSTGTAIKNGFNSALSAIVDGNVTTIIAGVILYILGTGTIRGFAQTLIIGLVLSMFTSLVITRLLVNAFHKLGVTSPAFYAAKVGQTETKVLNIVQKRTVWIGISAVVVVIGIVAMIVGAVGGNGAFNYDIQFTGGTSIEVNIGEDFDQDALEELVAGAVTDDTPVIQKVTSENKAIIKLKSVIDDITVQDALEESAVSDEAVEAEAADSEEAADTEEAEAEVASVVSEAEADAEAAAEDEEAAVSADTEEADDAEAADTEEAEAVDADEEADAADEENVIDISPDQLIDNGDGTYSISPDAFEGVTDEDGNAIVVEEEDATETTTEHVHTVATGEGYSGNIASVIAAVAQEYDLEDADFSVTQISATISSEMTKNAVLAVFLSCIAMLIYVSLRFKDIRTGSSSIIALIHDALIVLTCYALLRIPLSNSFIAAILTVLGYSINASIVIFDRIRENKNSHRKWSAEQLVNTSVSQCMKRSIYTSLTTLFTIGALYVLGVQSIKEFALPIVVGIVAGTWSSILISGSVWYLLEKIKFNKK